MDFRTHLETSYLVEWGDSLYFSSHCHMKYKVQWYFKENCFNCLFWPPKVFSLHQLYSYCTVSQHYTFIYCSFQSADIKSVSAPPTKTTTVIKYHAYLHDGYSKLIKIKEHHSYLQLYYSNHV